VGNDAQQSSVEGSSEEGVRNNGFDKVRKKKKRCALLVLAREKK
jgi:hypothetical protein